MADGDERMLGTGDDSGPDLLYEIARWRLDEQLERVKWQDNKLAATFTLNAAVIALFGVAIALTTLNAIFVSVAAIIATLPS